MNSITTKKAIPVEKLHHSIKDEINALMLAARQASSPLIISHLQESAKTLSRLYSKITEDYGLKRQQLDFLTTKKEKLNSSFKSLDGNTPFRKLSNEIAESLQAQRT